MPRSIHPAIFVVTLTAAALAASVVLFGGRGVVTDAPALVGSWELEGIFPEEEDARLALHSDGRYAIATASTSGGFDLVECGRWRSLEGRFQMRAAGGMRVESPRVLLLSQPGLRLGSVERVPPSGSPERQPAELLLKPAKRGAPEERWRLYPAAELELQPGAGKAARRLYERCGL